MKMSRYSTVTLICLTVQKTRGRFFCIFRRSFIVANFVKKRFLHEMIVGADIKIVFFKRSLMQIKNKSRMLLRAQKLLTAIEWYSNHWQPYPIMVFCL